MTTQKPRFLFDNIFDEEYQEKMRRAAAAARMAELEAEEHAAPTYSQEEVDEAKETSYQLGRQEGMSAAMAGIEQQVSVNLEGVLSKVDALNKLHRQWAGEMQRDAVRLSATIMRKMAPELTRGSELPQIEHVINQAFQFLTEQPKVMIRVAAELEAPLRDKVQLMASRVGYEGEVVLVGDPELVATDCRVSWAAGAVERALDETWNEIDEMVERTMSALPVRSNIGSDMPPDSEPDDVPEPEELALPDTQEESESNVAHDEPAPVEASSLETFDAVPETPEEGVDEDGNPSEAELIQN